MNIFNRNLTDKNGFPKAKCPGIIDKLGNCVEGVDPQQQISIYDGTKSAYENIKNALDHYGKTVGAVGVNKVLDVLTGTLLGIDTKGIDKEKVIGEANRKLQVLQALRDDPKSKEVLNELNTTIAEIIRDTTKDAKEPIEEAIANLSSSTFDSLKKTRKDAIDFAENSIKIIPGIGDAYIILDNALSFTKGTTKLADASTESANIILDATNKIGRKFVDRIDMNSEKLDKIMDNLKSIQDIQKKVEGDIGSNIQKTGSFIGDSIRSAAPTSLVKDVPYKNPGSLLPNTPTVPKPPTMQPPALPNAPTTQRSALSKPPNVPRPPALSRQPIRNKGGKLRKRTRKKSKRKTIKRKTRR